MSVSRSLSPFLIVLSGLNLASCVQSVSNLRADAVESHVKIFIGPHDGANVDNYATFFSTPKEVDEIYGCFAPTKAKCDKISGTKGNLITTVGERKIFQLPIPPLVQKSTYAAMASYAAQKPLYTDTALIEIATAPTTPTPTPGVTPTPIPTPSPGTANLGDKDLDLTTSTGAKIKLSAIMGNAQYVMIDFSSSGCGPCISLAQEIETRKDLFENGKCKTATLVAGSDMDNWLGITGTPEAAKTAYGSSSLTSAASALGFSLTFTPSVLTIDRQGKVVSGEGSPDAFIPDFVEEKCR